MLSLSSHCLSLTSHCLRTHLTAVLLFFKKACQTRRCPPGAHCDVGERCEFAIWNPGVSALRPTTPADWRPLLLRY